MSSLQDGAAGSINSMVMALQFCTVHPPASSALEFGKRRTNVDAWERHPIFRIYTVLGPGDQINLMDAVQYARITA